MVCVDVFSPVVLISGSSSTACMCAVQLVNSVLTVTVHYLALCCTGVGHELQPALFLFPWGAQQEHILPQRGVNLRGHPGGHQQQWPPLLLRGWWLHQVQTAARERYHDAPFYLRIRVIASFISCTLKSLCECGARVTCGQSRVNGRTGKGCDPSCVTCSSDMLVLCTSLPHESIAQSKKVLSSSLFMFATLK